MSSGFASSTAGKKRAAAKLKGCQEGHAHSRAPISPGPQQQKALTILRGRAHGGAVSALHSAWHCGAKRGPGLGEMTEET